MIVGGAILPHPPILLPEYAAQRGTEADGTIDAVERACGRLAEFVPDRIVISAPHLGHGFDVPLWFLARRLGTLPPLERLLTDDPSYARYRELGCELGARENALPGRAVVIASGDLSHRLQTQGPYGFHESGPQLDEAILGAVRRADAAALLAIDRELIEEGAECGLRSIIFGLSALEPARAEVLAYEGPYGVGYLVATLEPLAR